MPFVDAVLENRDKLDKITDRAAREMAKRLEAARKDALAELRKIELKGQALAQARKQVMGKLADITDLMKGSLRETTATLKAAKKTSLKLSMVEAATSLENATGKDVSFGGSFGQVFKQALKKSQQKKVLGVKEDKAFEGVSKWQEIKLRDAFTDAIAKGSSIDDLAKEITYVTEVSQRAATRIARTHMTSVMNDAHKDVYDANGDILKGYEWNATLDGRTSLICATLHGKFWPIGSQPPGPPAHPNCRSVLMPVLKDSEGIPDAGQRVRNLDGKGTTVIDGETTFDDWLMDQNKDDRIEFIGSEVREDLWHSGKISFEDLVKPDLTPRTDKEAIELALAKNPADSELKALAKEHGVKQRKLKNINKEMRKLENEQEFDAGEEQE